MSTEKTITTGEIITDIAGNSETAALAKNGGRLARIIDTSLTAISAGSSAKPIIEGVAAGADALSLIDKTVDTGSRATRILETGITALKIGGKGIAIIGGVIVASEALGLTRAAHAAHAEGDITTLEFAALEGIYASHIAQGTLDPTGFGGEIIIQKAYSELSEDWPPELQEELRPSSLADLFEPREKSPQQVQFEAILDALERTESHLLPETQKLSQLYMNVVDAEDNYEHLVQNISYGLDALSMEKMQASWAAEVEMDNAYEAYTSYYKELQTSGALSDVIRELNGELQPATETPVIALQREFSNTANSAIEIDRRLLQDFAVDGTHIGGNKELICTAIEKSYIHAIATQSSALSRTSAYTPALTLTTPS